ncbi:MAG TPA: hypothetical protein V6D20_18405 [Candidatus Obscuribacterales bacterium]
MLDFSDDAITWMRANQLVNVIGGKVKRSPNGITLDVTGGKGKGKGVDTKPPLWVTLYRDPTGTWKIYAQDGKVVTRSNASGDAIGTLSISGLPTEASPQTVLKGDKISVKIDTNTDGQATTATWTKTAEADPWPTSIATELAGGETSGTAGVHYIRIASIAEVDVTTGTLERTQIHTGHVDYFQPILCENAVVTAVGGQARILQRFRLTNGDWVFRTLAGAGTGGEPIFIGEDAGKARIYSTGDTFIAKLWQTDITLLSGGGGGTLEIDNGSSPTATFYVWKGIWFTAQPTGFPAGATEYHFSYVTPTTGGPPP